MLRPVVPRFWILSVRVCPGPSVVPAGIVKLYGYAVGGALLTLRSTFPPSWVPPLHSDILTTRLVVRLLPVVAITMLPVMVVGNARSSPVGIAGASSQSAWLLPPLIATFVPLVVGLERLSFRVIVASLRR